MCTDRHDFVAEGQGRLGRPALAALKMRGDAIGFLVDDPAALAVSQFRQDGLRVRLRSHREAPTVSDIREIGVRQFRRDRAISSQAVWISG